MYSVVRQAMTAPIPGVWQVQGIRLHLTLRLLQMMHIEIMSQRDIIIIQLPRVPHHHRLHRTCSLLSVKAGGMGIMHLESHTELEQMYKIRQVGRHITQTEPLL